MDVLRRIACHLPNTIPTGSTKNIKSKLRLNYELVTISSADRSE